jgi:hypothetical protein
MKTIRLIVFFVFISSLVKSQNKTKIYKEQERLIIQDSLGLRLNAVYYYLKANLENKVITISDICKVLGHFYENFEDSIQTSDCIFPHMVVKKDSYDEVKKQLIDIVGEKNCKIKFEGWTGYNGKGAHYTMAKFNIHHHNYDDQLILIFDTRGSIASFGSTNSVAQLTENH